MSDDSHTPTGRISKAQPGLQPKDTKSVTLRCRLGFHKWTVWGGPYEETIVSTNPGRRKIKCDIQKRTCIRCFEERTRFVQ